MATPTASQDLLSGFNHPRTRPELPPGYEWTKQIRKYCPSWLPHHLHSRAQPTSTTQAEKRYPGIVFCHRGLYDRAMKVPENSKLSIQNGIEQGLLLHEVDARIGQYASDTFLAHDEVANRVTSKTRRWTSLNMSEIMDTALVIRRFDEGKDDFASSYQETDETVPDLETLLLAGVGEEVGKWKDGEFIAAPFRSIPDKGHCLQLDLRGDDFPKAIEQFQTRPLDIYRVILKGYNLDFAFCNELEAALASVAAKRSEPREFKWDHFPGNPHIIMVFYSQPLVGLALQGKGIDSLAATPTDRFNLKYKEIYDTVMDQVSSFIGIRGLNFTPEIVHTGLGLGYDIQTGNARNPLDGTTITDAEVILESRIDRAMIDASLELRRRYPKMYFSSCTRLCEVSTSKGELVADIKTGRLKLKPVGEKGISTKLRSIHGGLYPQSHLVVADDPFAEIAARTWIDEYAKLKRSQLLTMTYEKWLAQARKEVVVAVNKLNGPFLPNKYDGLLEGRPGESVL